MAKSRMLRAELAEGMASPLTEFLSLPGRQSAGTKNLDLLRRIKRMVLFVLLACVGLAAAVSVDSGTPGLGSLSLIVIMVAGWATIGFVEEHLRQEAARSAVQAEAARLEGARLTANAMQDRVANKLSVTVGYCEMLVGDGRLEPDLREQAQRALDGALTAAKTMSELRRLTRQSERTDELPAVLLDFQKLAALEPERPNG